MNYWYFSILLVFPAYHFVKYTILIGRAQKYITEYNNYWKSGDAALLLFYKTRINSLLNNANYVAKSYLKTEWDEVNYVILHRQAPITDVFLEPQYKDEFLETMIVAIGELSRVRAFAYNPAYWVKRIVLIPVSVLSVFGFRPRKVTALIVSVIGWLSAYVLTAFQPEIKVRLIDLLNRWIPK